MTEPPTPARGSHHLPALRLPRLREFPLLVPLLPPLPGSRPNARWELEFWVATDYISQNAARAKLGEWALIGRHFGAHRKGLVKRHEAGRQALRNKTGRFPSRACASGHLHSSLSPLQFLALHTFLRGNCWGRGLRLRRTVLLSSSPPQALHPVSRPGHSHPPQVGRKGGVRRPGARVRGLPPGPAQTPLSNRAPKCGAAVKPEERLHAILHILRRLLSPNRKERKNHTSKLQELALLLPVSLKPGTKKLTKKEILLHVLQYIQYLQKNIDVAKALLKLYTTDGEGGLGGPGQNPTGGPPRQRHSTPSSSPCSRKTRLRGACQKPQKKKPTQTSERQTRDQKPRRCLTLCKPKKVTPAPDQERGNTEGTTSPLRCTDSDRQPKAAPSSPQGGEKRGRAQLTVLDMAESGAHCGLSSCCFGNSAQDDEPSPALGVQKDAEKFYFLNRTQPCPRQQELVFYDSSEEVDKESPDADPWLPAWTAEGSPHGSPLALGPPQIKDWSATGPLSEILGLSPSLFTSPGRLLPEQILEDGTEYLTQALFEDVYLGPESPLSACKSEAPENKNTPPEAPGDPTDAHSQFQSSVSLDHCYLSLSETSPGSGTTETESPWKRQEDAQPDPEDSESSSEEDGDYTWTPTRRASVLPPGGRKARKARATRGPVKSKEGKKVPYPTPMKKKCVNGFIMFCRMNRKQYIRACPGTASTAATKELAQLWRVMTLQERKPYCIKARRFSRQHNRIVKQERSSSEDDDWDPPKPFYQLLAEKARSSPSPGRAPQPPPGQ
nr:basic helix-loop-helix and HMG box domain-containing protein 1 [Loxodonta africana]